MTATSSRAIPRRHGPAFDERRNTSRVWAVPPDALPAALAALANLRTDDPELVAWVEAGAPRLTHEEHRARFGHDYDAPTRRRSRKAA